MILFFDKNFVQHPVVKYITTRKRKIYSMYILKKIPHTGDTKIYFGNFDLSKYKHRYYVFSLFDIIFLQSYSQIRSHMSCVTCHISHININSHRPYHFKLPPLSADSLGTVIWPTLCSVGFSTKTSTQSVNA